MDLMNLLSLNDKFLDYFVDALKFTRIFTSASFMIKVAPILFFIVNRCNILKLNDSCPLFSNLTRANDYGKWEMKTDMEHAGRVSVSSLISVKVGIFLRQIFYILKEIKIFGRMPLRCLTATFSTFLAPDQIILGTRGYFFLIFLSEYQNGSKF